tara:strand:+ start:256 stop:1140 length:885 start_codon:yes stop_codon:yes gene_type:complete
MYILKKSALYIFIAVTYAVFSIVFIETKFQNNLDVLSSENLPTYNGNCPFSIEEGLLISRYNQIKFKSEIYIDLIKEFDGTLPECTGKVVGANYDQNIQLNKVTDLTLIVEENNVSKTFLIFKAFAPLIIFFIFINLIIYFFIRKDNLIIFLILFVFFISAGIDNFYKGIDFSNSNYSSSVQTYRELQSIFYNKTIYHNGFVDEEKLAGISKAKLIYNPDLVADFEINSDIQIFIEYQIETLINQPNYEQRYNSRNNINTEILRLVVEKPIPSGKFITLFNPNENTLYFLNYDD